MRTIIAEYIWIDGIQPTPKLRSKTKIFRVPEEKSDQIFAQADEPLLLQDFPDWSFDGSSTNQADGSSSDVILKPVNLFIDPMRGPDSYIVMCETFNADGSPNFTNYRRKLAETLELYEEEHYPWIGFEQEYVFMKEGRPLGWPQGGYPPPQGPFYCGVGSDEVFGRKLVETHMWECIDIGIELTGVNAEVMPGQWEYQVFGKDLLHACDSLWVSRYMLYRIGEAIDVSVTLFPKPVQGDWNGSGMHTNFSTRAMREEGGMAVIEDACERLGRQIERHLEVYGASNDQRLTGEHETCSISDFRYGISDRGASIRIPIQTAQDGMGYLEDRRPAANADPYRVAEVLVRTVCED